MQKGINHNISIGWPGPVTSKKYGNVAYEAPLKRVLSENFNLDFINVEGRRFKNKYLGGFTFLFNLAKLKGKKDLWIRDFYSTVTMSFDKTQGKNLVIVHHLDVSGFPPIMRFALNLLNSFFYLRNLKKADAVVAVSEYWKDYLFKIGCKKIYKIYNSFNMSDFNISSDEIFAFKRKYDLDLKPIIYLGNCQKAKGVIEAYQSLKDLDVYLVTSGEQKVKIPAMNLNLDYRDYLKLLKASSITITMSKFEEGWCRTAHEAMILKTPVIGSGLGGMKELLEGGKQIVCEDFKDLKGKVEHLLKHFELREQMGQDGFNYAKDFTVERFKKEWLELIKNIIL